MRNTPTRSVEQFLGLLVALSLFLSSSSCTTAAYERTRTWPTQRTQFRLSSIAQAATAANQWESVDVLAPGSSIVLTLKGGVRVDGQFERSDPDTVMVIDLNGSERNIPKFEVEQIVRPADGLADGALIGAGLGLGLGLAMLGIIAASAGEGENVLPSAKLFAPLLGSGVGLVVGIVLDSRRHEAKVIYQSVD